MRVNFRRFLPGGGGSWKSRSFLRGFPAELLDFDDDDDEDDFERLDFELFDGFRDCRFEDFGSLKTAPSESLSESFLPELPASSGLVPVDIALCVFWFWALGVVVPESTSFVFLEVDFVGDSSWRLSFFLM